MSTTPEEQPAVACCHHPDVAATQNCMGCGKPLCMDCVRASGYYCSPTCKARVQATEPDAVTEEQESCGAVDQQIEHTMAATGKIVRGLLWPTLVVLVAAVGFYVVGYLTRPVGRVIAEREVSSRLAQFHVAFIPPDRWLVQADNELSLTRAQPQETVWTADLGALGDRPRVVDRTNDRILISTGQRLLALDAATGVQQWEIGDDDRYLGRVMATDQGVLLAAGTELRCVATATGRTIWSTTNQVWGGGARVLAGRRLVATQPVAVTATADDHETDDVPTAGMGQAPINARDLIGMLGGKPATTAETDTYRIEFLDASSGRPVGECHLALSDDPTLLAVDGWLVVYGGQNVAVFTPDAVTPAWQTALPSEIVSVAASADVLAVATENQVILLDARDGKLLWERTDLSPTGLTIGPDGEVYATVALEKDAAREYRAAHVAERGSALPSAATKVLLQLDPTTGRTNWGVRNIGDQLVFEKERLYVFDNTTRVDLLANSGLMGSEFSVRELNPRNGRDRWFCVQKGVLLDQWIAGGTAYVVVMTDTPSGRIDPHGLYALKLIRPN